MKINIFIGSLAGGGAERVATNLSNHLSANHDVSLITMSDIPPSYNIAQDIRIIPLINKSVKNGFMMKNFRRLLRLRKILKADPADLYLVMLPGTINLLLSQRKIIKSPIIVSERCDPYTRYEKSPIRKQMMKWMYPLADGYVFQTDMAAKYYENQIGIKGAVIPNAINDEFMISDRINIKKLIIGVGRLSEQKNFSMLIRAFAEVSKEYPEFRLAIYGEGEERDKLEKLISDLKMDNYISLPGFVKNISEVLGSVYSFVLSSNFEGMPNALMEAMALGIPCISTDCPSGGPEYLIQSGVNGILIKVGDDKALAEQLRIVMSNENYAKKLGENAKQITTRLSAENIYQEWEEYMIKIKSKA